MEFKNAFKALRKENNFTVADIAKMLNKTESAIRMWEAGNTKPDADTIVRLSGFFNVSADYLLGISEVRSLDIDTKIVCEKLRLSEKSIDVLANLQSNDKILKTINFLLENIDKI